MPQERISVDGFSAVQPKKFDYNFSTTSTEDSGRPMSGVALITPLFTTEAFAVEYGELTPAQASTLLHAIVQRPGKPFFSLHYFSPYYGTWRTADFYVGDGSLKIKNLKIGSEKMKSITCNFVGRFPVV